jgi:glycolate oxidase
MGPLAPNYYVQDGVIPRTKLPEVLDRIEELAASTACASATSSTRRRQPAPARALRRRRAGREGRGALGRDPRACVEAGGSITGEHGVGVDKKRYMPQMFEEPDLGRLQRLRCAFDPRGLANPGKVMPTPRLCGEGAGVYQQHPLEQGRTWPTGF